MINNNKLNNTDYRHRVSKLSVGRVNLKLKIQHSKRDKDKIKNKINNIRINYDFNNINNNSGINHKNSLINKKGSIKEYSRDKRAIIEKNKKLSIISNNNDILNYNNYKTNDNNKKNNNCMDINNNENENENNPYTNITLNTNNPCANNNDEKDRINKNYVSVDSKYNITVNKKKHNINTNNLNNINNCNNSIKVKEKINLNLKDDKKIGVIKRTKRDLSTKAVQDNLNFNFSYGIYSQEKRNSNYVKKKNHSPFELNDTRRSHKIHNINNTLNKNMNSYNNNNNTLQSKISKSNNSQKMKNNISNNNIMQLNNNSTSNNTNNAINGNVNNVSNNRTITIPNEDEEFFEYENDKNQELSKEEKLIYGNRIMKGYNKIKLLGKGGCGIVWLCNKINKNTKFNNDIIGDEIIENENDEYAVKQIAKKGGLINMSNENIITAKNEIKILSKLNSNENNIFIPKIYDYYEDNNDIWFSFEKGGISISGLCFKIKGEFEKGERIYLIQKGNFLMSLFSTISQFKYLLKSLLSGIDYINKKGIIHSDIKPENILIEYTGDSNDKNFEIKSIKIIDFGSSFFVNNTATINSNTPEYLCPEITSANKKFIKELKKNNIKYINCVDIWSLGITFLELCLCCPTWMSYKTKVIINGKTYHSSGLFGCRGRDGVKIYQKQIELSKNIKKKLKNSMLYLFQQNDKDNFIDLLKKMLEFDYKKRITCQDAINHPFFKEEI